jgi:hypothetical protein
MKTESELIRKSNLSCSFCGPGTWSTWEVVTDDGVFFVCDRHHVEMSQAKSIRLERMRSKETWSKISEPKEILFDDEHFDDPIDFKDDYE